MHPFSIRYEGDRFRDRACTTVSDMTTPRLAVAALIAVATLLTGCAGAPAATQSPSAVAPRPSATPTPTPEPAQAEVPFDGDCARVLPADVLADVFDGEEPTVREQSYLRGVMPDPSGSLAQLGGLACLWVAQTSQIERLAVVVAPVGAVPAELVAAREAYSCYEWGICGRGEIRSGMWVLAEAPQLQQREAASPEETELLTAAVDIAIQSVFAHEQEEFAGTPTAPAEDWWDLPACDAFEPAVAAAAGMTAPERGFPGDNVPEGAAWDIITAAGVAQWCPWYDLSSGSARTAELYLQAGVGAPSDAQLAVAEATPITVRGADAAYRFAHEKSSARSVEVLVVVGANRLLATGDDAEAVAAAALELLVG